MNYLHKRLIKSGERVKNYFILTKKTLFISVGFLNFFCGVGEFIYIIVSPS